MPEMVSEQKNVPDIKSKNIKLRNEIRDWGSKVKNDTFKMGNDPKTLKMLSINKKI